MVTDYSKQMNLINVNDFDKKIHVIGAGAAGSWLVQFLLRMGFKNVNVYDFDDIEEHNLPNQGYSENDINKSKVESLMSWYKSTFNDVDDRLKVFNRRIEERHATAFDGIVMCCVDDMDIRKMIYEKSFKYGKAELFIEVRLSIYGAYVYTLYRDNNWNEEYEKTLYGNEEAEVSSCGVSQTGLPAAVNAVSIMIMQMISWYNGETPYNKIEYSVPQLVSMVA